MRQVWASAALALTLTACGNDENRNDPLRLVGMFGDGRSAEAAPSSAQLAQAALEQLREPVMLAEVENGARRALLVPLGENGAVRTWTTVDRQTISIRGGRVVATRGLGADLMSASLPGVGQGGRHGFVTLNAAHERVAVAAECRISVAELRQVELASRERIGGRYVAEDCARGGAVYRNEFWFDGSGRVRKSRQWSGTTLGFLTLEVLRP